MTNCSILGDGIVPGRPGVLRFQGLPSRLFVSLTLLLLLAPLSAFAQSFKNPGFYSTGSDPSTVSVGDFNKDGIPDLVYVDGGQAAAPNAFLHVILGNGDGTFTHKQDVALPAGIGGKVTVADVNNDGILDLVLGCDNAQAEVAVLLGNGDGSFQSPIVSTFTGSGSDFVTVRGLIGVADFNNDGAVDLAVSDILNDAIYILTGNNTGSFTLKTTIFNGAGPSNVYTADFNGDGNIDMLVEGAVGANVTVYLGNGNATFQTGVSYTGPNYVTGVVLHDMNGDGHLDMVISGYNNTVSILLGNANGTFSTSSAGGTNNSGPLGTILDVFDFNGDGILDLATASDNGICILLGQGNLTYGPPVPYSGSTSPATAVMADFNGDGFQDFAEIAPGGIAIIFGAAGGTLEGPALYDLGEGLNAVTVGDFDGNNIPDIAVDAAEPTPRLLVGKGDGTFTVEPSSSAGTTSIPGQFISTGDFNGDGISDLVVTGGTTAGNVFFGNGNATFSAPVPLTIPGQVGRGFIAIGDFNNDGTSDIASLDYESLDILLGQKNNTFVDVSTSYPALNFAGGAAAADFNKDGKLDLVVSQGGPNPLQVLLGNGDGTFQIGSQLPAVNLPQILAAVDVDGDGNPDVVACLGFFNLAQIFYGNGDGTFQAPVNIQLERGYTQMVVADVNGDGRPDLIFSDGSVISILLNTGNRTFGSETHFLAGYIANFAVEDLNGDGLADIVVANGNTGNGGSPTTVTVLINQGHAGSVGGQLSTSPNPATYAQPFTISLTLQPSGSSLPAPTGTVAITIDDLPVTTIPVTGLNLSYTDPNSPSLAVGIHTIVAAYSGDTNYLAGGFIAQIQIVPIVYPTTTTLTASSTSILASQTVRFTASVTSPGQDANAPNPLGGTVVFRDGTTNLGTALLNGSQVATFDTALLSSGTHNVTANYLGYAAGFEQIASFAASTSPIVTVTVDANSTSTSLSASPTSTQVGSVVSLTAVVSSGAGTPTGAVTISNGNAVLAVQPLDGTGTAVYSTTFGNPGTQVLTAAYQANASFAASTSPPLSLVVNATSQSNQSVTSLSAIENSSVSGALTLLARVSGGDGPPIGQLTFRDGAESLGNASLNAQGVAVFTISSLGAGLHYFSAIYSGNSVLRASVSPILIERVPLNEPDFSLNLSSSSIVISQGQSASVATTIEPINGFNHRVALACEPDTPRISCQFGRALLPGGQGTTMVTIKTVGSQATVPLVGASFLDIRFAFLGVLLLSSIVFVIGTRTARRLSFLLVCLVCLVAVPGCRLSSSGSTSAPTPLGNHVVTIIGSCKNANGPAIHSAQVAIVVEPLTN